MPARGRAVERGQVPPLFYRAPLQPLPPRTHAVAFQMLLFVTSQGSVHRRSVTTTAAAFTAGERLKLSAAEAKALLREQDARASPSRTFQQMCCATR